VLAGGHDNAPHREREIVARERVDAVEAIEVRVVDPSRE